MKNYWYVVGMSKGDFWNPKEAPEFRDYLGTKERRNINLRLCGGIWWNYNISILYTLYTI